MTGSSTLNTTATSGSPAEVGARSSTFDWDYFTTRCDDLGASTHEQRAELAGLTLRTYYRLKRAETSLTLDKLAEVAENLKTTSALLMGVGK